MSHSKRNTSRPVFTSHERALARAAWSSSSARLSRDSFIPFGACGLCLEPARDPVACAHGDIFCRECALANLLAQKKEIRRLEKGRERAEKEAAEERARQEAEAQERAVRDFEKTLAGEGATAAGRRDGAAAEADADGRPEEPRVGAKRKFVLDAEDLDRVAESDRRRARRALDDEKADSSRSALRSFWIPSLTPIANSSAETKKTKALPVCPSSQEGQPHSYSLHTLITLHVSTEAEPSTGKDRWICPSCRKGLTNTASPVLSRPCGHVLCQSCITRTMKTTPAEEHVACLVCDVDLGTGGQRDGSGKAAKGSAYHNLIDLRSEGTGFSARGSSMVKKSDVSFQC